MGTLLSASAAGQGFVTAGSTPARSVRQKWRHISQYQAQEAATFTCVDPLGNTGM